ncbi:uncharacterized protein At4g10930-like isoform X4 [Amaranthus tricolor]|uniref:uncharacterized protein At4g10930-like isoform X4 n=1 Tax=Amaranthus tricolor TaxID=29722 RepID=UPI0025866EC1|nr:uncharacterized protein At4g10930-like isoform X4 [Amaranthus tricolor]
MEVELFRKFQSEEDTVEADAEYDNLGSEVERCGICMDVVVDRGVLDCCQHWFCFDCIDNWSTITNLCPLCQNEFQLITCVPVFDTIGTSKNDEDLDSRDGDWCVEGNDNILSFPSYYIDEDAVNCLDDYGCKIRSGSLSYEETSILDTSIACDSCDIWYHAFCVGFDPEGTGLDSWLCPRCSVNEANQNSDLKKICNSGNDSNSHHLVDTSSGKLSICVADTGETAVVVSRIDGQDDVNVPITNCLSNQEPSAHHETEQSMLGPDYCSNEMKKVLNDGIGNVQPDLMVMSANVGGISTKVKPDDCESRMSTEPRPSFASTLSAVVLEHDKTNNSAGRDECPHGTSTDESLDNVKADVSPSSGEKRKRSGYSFQKDADSGHHEGRFVGESSAKKVKVQRRTSTLNNQAVCPPEESRKKNRQIGSSLAEISDDFKVNKNKPVDIMSIVQGTELRTANRSEGNGKCAKGEKNAAGLRVKKIMRRPSEDKESDAVVQNLRKEIREAVRNRPSCEVGKSIVDPNLLAAFRAAVSGSIAEPSKKTSSAIIKSKKLMLQKGRARENLTKKIYATSSGKRRRAWDRDCEIEFWKHRCLRTSKLEKIETLKSVLKLLRRNPESKVVEQNFEEDSPSPILSRLYVADTSLFPRKDDIKPLSVLKAAASNQNGSISSAEKCVESCPDSGTVKSLDRNEDPTKSVLVSVDDKKKSICTSSKNGVVAGKLQATGYPNKEAPQKMTGKTDDVKVDKRKWALEVLARKNASNVSNPMHQKHDNTALKGNYPLLAELPTDMRPKLASARHNKIPVSVRQAQLYRLTEHFLKMTNLSSMVRTAATELAVADAINIEKQVADRSSSKAVYLNLCSQEIRNHTNTIISDTPPTSPSVPVSCTGDQSLTLEHLNSEAQEALRAAGLLSDSPPNSPLHKMEYFNDDESFGEVKEVKSIFEMDCHPDLDIYGDFEYDLDEEDYIGTTAIVASKAQAEEAESKVKVVFSTLSSNTLDNGLEAKEQDLPKADNLSSPPNLLGCPNDPGCEGSTIEDKVDSVPLAGDTPLVGEGEVLSVAECEELYGPEKEPLTQQIPDLVPVENLALQNASNLNTSNSDTTKVVTDSVQGINVETNTSDPSDPIQKPKDEKDGVLVVDKKSEQPDSVLKKVEAYIKEHVRPFCKSGVITVEQYRWTVKKTTEKVMKYHSKEKNANFLIKEGEKVKKLAAQYLATVKHKENK